MEESAGAEGLWPDADHQAYPWLTEKETERLSKWEEKVWMVKG
jgi:hypothetical protein